jgi:hypothetical protein
MTDETLTCVICHEEMESHHQVVQPKHCNHIFHAICIHVWLARHKSCPVCRQRISLTTQAPWRILFSTALAVSLEMTIERITYTYSFLTLMLKRFKTASEWLDARDGIVYAAEQFEIGTTKLPYLDLTTRVSAKQERQKWTNVFKELVNEHPRESVRVYAAHRWIYDKLHFIFQREYEQT